MKNTFCILAAFILGQSLQVGIQVFSQAVRISKPILFCVGAGAVVVLAVCVGIWLANYTHRETYTALPMVFDYEDQVN